MTLLPMLFSLSLLACGDKDPPPDSEETDTDTDTDADSDTDSDTDADSDTDSDTDADTDTDTDTDPNTEVYRMRTGEYAKDDAISVEGVVVGPATDYGFFLLDGHEGPWHCVYVYLGSPATVSEGDGVTVTGVVGEYQGLAEVIADPADVSVVSNGNALPAVNAVTTSELADDATAEGYESCLVQVTDVTVTDADLGYGEWSIDDGVVVNDLFEPEVPWEVLYEGDTFTALTGVLNYSFENFKIEPRTGDDIEGYASNGPSCAADKCIEDVSDGELVITELLINPTTGDDNYCEYIEVYNAGTGSIDLSRMVTADDDSSTGAVSDTLVVAAGDYALIAKSDSATWATECATLATAFTPDGYYGNSPSIANTGDPLLIKRPDGTTIDEIPTHTGGDSWSLNGDSTPDATTNDSTGSWCESTTEIATDGTHTDYGTPGAPNDSCDP